MTASIPKAARPAYEAVVLLTDLFCRAHLNNDYAALCRKLAGALARKRPTPLARGKPAVWACGIVYALGGVNFLFDPKQTPHLRADDLCRLFGVGASSGSLKARLIREMFDMFQLHPDWCLPSLLDKNPLVWILKVNGLLMDIRDAPRAAQQVAYEQGLIPYIPADREAEGRN